MKPGFRACLTQTGTKPSFIWIPLPDTNYAPYRADLSLPRVVRMRFGGDLGLGCATRAARSARHRLRVAGRQRGSAVADSCAPAYGGVIRDSRISMQIPAEESSSRHRAEQCERSSRLVINDSDGVKARPGMWRSNVSGVLFIRLQTPAEYNSVPA